MLSLIKASLVSTYAFLRMRHSLVLENVACAETRDLIRKMSTENPLGRDPRSHGELKKLGIEVSQATVSKHREGTRPPRSYG
jgi:hypothetical protein